MRCANADVARLQGQQRFVLDRTAKGGEGPLVPNVLEHEVPVDAKEEVGIALVASEHLDEEVLARFRRPEPRRRTPRVDRRRRELPEFDTARRERVRDLAAR